MKTILVFCLVLVGGFAYGAPFLITNAVDPATCGGVDQPPCPVSATCYEDGSEFASEVTLEPDMSINIDLEGRPAGTHRYTCIYHDEFGGISVSSNPTQLGSREPQNLRLSP